jgi:hypothetical protein
MWSVTDPESAVTARDGCDPITFATDTKGAAATCKATSAGGSASKSIEIKIDQTVPAVACKSAIFSFGQANGYVYASVTDSTSGAAAPLVRKRVSTAAAGTFTARITGADNAGNTRTVSCKFTVNKPWYVAIGMPFAGYWARYGADALPGKHPIYSSGSDWSVDLYANNASVDVYVAVPTGSGQALRLTFNRIYVPNCGGKQVEINVFLDGKQIGTLVYAHLKPSSAVSRLRTGDKVSNGTTLGTTFLWTGCSAYVVTNGSGVHTHFEAKGNHSYGYACWYKRSQSNVHSRGYTIGRLGKTGVKQTRQLCN